MRRVTPPGRWVWGLCGLATAAALAVPGARLIVSAGVSQTLAGASSPPVVQTRILTRTQTVQQPVTSLNIQGYAGLIQVTAAPVSNVQVTETIAYHGSAPAVAESVSAGRLSLADPGCAPRNCSVTFLVRVPPSVTVTASGGPLVISGTSGANLDSDGTLVSATDIHGPLTVSTHGGPLQINGLTGPLRADTGGGQLVASRLGAATAAVTTASGPAQIAFSAAPESVTVNTGGGAATLTVPGGPYALTTNSAGAPEIIGIATSASAHRFINVTTGGGQLVINSRPIAAGLLPLPSRAGRRHVVAASGAAQRRWVTVNGLRPLIIGWQTPAQPLLLPLR